MSEIEKEGQCDFCFEKRVLESVDSHDLCTECAENYNCKHTYCSLHCAMTGVCTGDCIDQDPNL